MGVAESLGLNDGTGVSGAGESETDRVGRVCLATAAWTTARGAPEGSGPGGAQRLEEKTWGGVGRAAARGGKCYRRFEGGGGMGYDRRLQGAPPRRISPCACEYFGGGGEIGRGARCRGAQGRMGQLV